MEGKTRYKMEQTILPQSKKWERSQEEGEGVEQFQQPLRQNQGVGCEEYATTWIKEKQIRHLQVINKYQWGEKNEKTQNKKK